MADTYSPKTTVTKGTETLAVGGFGGVVASYALSYARATYPQAVFWEPEQDPLIVGFLASGLAAGFRMVRNWMKNKSSGIGEPIPTLPPDVKDLFQ